MKLFAIVLAAGTSSRFGSTKQLHEYHGMPLARRAICLAEAACGERSILVVGHQWQDVLPACGPLRGFFIRNCEYRSGIASSIGRGIGTVAHIADAVMLMLADQPLVTKGHLDALVAQWQQSANDIVASSYAGVLGPPVLFPARCFAELQALRGDSGARGVIAGDSGIVRTIPCEDAAVDIDCPPDLEAIS